MEKLNELQILSIDFGKKYNHNLKVVNDGLIFELTDFSSFEIHTRCIICNFYCIFLYHIDKKTNKITHTYKVRNPNFAELTCSEIIIENIIQ